MISVTVFIVVLVCRRCKRLDRATEGLETDGRVSFRLGRIGSLSERSIRLFVVKCTYDSGQENSESNYLFIVTAIAEGLHDN